MALKQVVLPAPLGPISPRISPGRMPNDTLSRATTPPNRMLTSRMASSGSPDAGPAGAAKAWSGRASGTGGSLLELLEPFVQPLGADAAARGGTGPAGGSWRAPRAAGRR